MCNSLYIFYYLKSYLISLSERHDINNNIYNSLDEYTDTFGFSQNHPKKVHKGI